MHKHYDLEERRWHDVEVVDPETGEVRTKRVRRFQTHPEGASLTQKHQAHDTDINVIVKRFGVTGQLPTRLGGLNLGAFDEIFDYQTAMNAVVAADRAFLTVDPDIRARFSNDPGRFMDFVLNKENEAELRKLGLWNALVEKPPEVVQKVEIVNPSSIPGSGVPPKA